MTPAKIRFLLVAMLAIVIPLLGTSAEVEESEETEHEVRLWNDIPVPPTCSNQKEVGPAYLCSAKVPFETVAKFYREEFKARGWEVTVRTKSDKGMFGGPMLSLDAKRKTQEANVMLIYSPSEQVTSVVLTPLSEE